MYRNLDRALVILDKRVLSSPYSTAEESVFAFVFVCVDPFRSNGLVHPHKTPTNIEEAIPVRFIMEEIIVYR
jgi:hypothetical protein